jgi:hypothetical protein
MIRWRLRDVGVLTEETFEITTYGCYGIREAARQEME